MNCLVLLNDMSVRLNYKVFIQCIQSNLLGIKMCKQYIFEYS